MKLLSPFRDAMVIGIGTLLAAIRNRLILISLFFIILLVGLSVSAASVSIGERARLIIDVGLAAASGLGSIIALTLTITSFAGELEKHTAFPILVRPIPRWAFLLGKYLGVLVTMILLITSMVIATAIITTLFGGSVPSAFWYCLWLSYVEIAVVCAIALLFSTLTQSVLAAAYTVGILIAGNLSTDILGLAQNAEQNGDIITSLCLWIAYYIIPDLGDLSARSQAANSLDVPDGFIIAGTFYGLCYCIATLALAGAVFNRRKII